MTPLPASLLPDISDPLTAPHWAAALEGRLAMQRCDACGYVRWPAARTCPECLTDGGSWATLSGHGTIWSYAVYPEPLHPAFAGQTPYAVGLVRLDEGPMIYGRLEDDPAIFACDQKVVATFAELAPGVTVPRFRLATIHAGDRL